MHPMLVPNQYQQAISSTLSGPCLSKRTLLLRPLVTDRQKRTEQTFPQVHVRCTTTPAVGVCLIE